MMIVYDPILTSLPHLGLDIGREKGAREGTLKKRRSIFDRLNFSFMLLRLTISYQCSTI